MREAFIILAVSAIWIPVWAQVSVPEPTRATRWSAAQMQDIAKRAAGKVDPQRKVGIEQLLQPSPGECDRWVPIVLHRTGPSEGEIHEKIADFIVVRDGHAIVFVGGRLLNAQSGTCGETRGTGIDGGTRYELRTGDTLYIPPKMAHQIVVEPGEHLTATVIKIVPQAN
jgi:mannose-6-phosphate isomerase-like protein (cupin superfamily)